MMVSKFRAVFYLLFAGVLLITLFASAQGKFSGPIEVQRQSHLYDRASQEAAWQTVVKVSGVDLSHPASLTAGS